MSEKKSNNKNELNSSNVRNDLQSTSNGSNSLSLKKDKNFENNLKNFAADDLEIQKSKTMEYCALSCEYFLWYLGDVPKTCQDFNDGKCVMIIQKSG